MNLSGRHDWPARIVGLAQWLFSHRTGLLLFFAIVSVLLGVSATQLRVDAGFNKTIPLHHPYMRVFTEYQQSFGGANRILVALTRKQGDIYQPEFFKALRGLTNDVFFIPGVDRASVTSLFTPNVRFVEIVEEGFVGGNVVPANFSGSAADLETVRRNVLKSGQVGRLVANDFSGALVSAELLEYDPTSGTKLDYAEVAAKLERLRARYQTTQHDLHIIGFAKAVGDITDGARGVLVFFAIAFAVTALLLVFYFRSWKLGALALICALVPVLWLLGLLPLLGYGIDPLSILVPFLIFSIGVSHAVQMTNTWKQASLQGADGISASRNAFVKLFIPGTTALLANAIGFLVILHIEIAMVQEMAITASLGVALMILTNKVLLPVLLSYQRLDTQNVGALRDAPHPLWTGISYAASRRGSLWALTGALVLLVFGIWKGSELKTGDLGRGIPELRADSRYNTDTAAIMRDFSIGVYVLGVIAQTNITDACTRFDIMDTIDRFEWEMKNIDGVQSVKSLPGAAKLINAGWNENNLKWRVLSRNPQVLAQSVTPIDTATGLLNTDCSAMQVMIFTSDHTGETLARIVNAVKTFDAQHRSDALQFKLATGNAGVMAATNEAVDAAEITMLVWLFAAISLLVLWEFRSLTAWLCIVLPLALVSLLCNAVMAMLGIGLKVSTLPVIALGVGVGVDYGIYLYERMQHHFRVRGVSLREAFYQALCERGTAAVFTAITMSIGVGSWAFSALKFQADMGLLLAFMFMVNMLGAIFLLPAIAAWTLRRATPLIPNP